MFLKAVVTGHGGGLEGLDAVTEVLSLSPALGRTSLYTLGLMTSQLYCVCYPKWRFRHTKWPLVPGSDGVGAPRSSASGSRG